LQLGLFPTVAVKKNHSMTRPLTVACSLLLACSVAVGQQSSAEKPMPEGLKFFEAKIRPVLVQRCYKCHSAEALKKGKLEGELQLDTRAGMRQGGETGPAVVPGDVKASALLGAIRHDTFKMPPNTKLQAEVIADFAKWVEMGAPDPRDGQAVAVEQVEIDIEAGRKFWSFQPLRTSTPPSVKNTDWVQNDVDRFILAPLEAKGIVPNNEASRRTLIRRVYFDLWGLPPAPSEVAAFVADDSPEAYEQLIDRLLAGTHYGERWARHWLDLARFAESNGYAFDKDRPGAFHYRDFVIKALNEDMPYDRFLQLQLAGDQMAPQDYMAQAATGFLAAGPFTSQQTQKERERSRYEQLDDVVGTIGTTMLGLTIGCARCHDHKFDPLPTRDYYRFTSCFAETGFQDYDHDPDPAATKAAKDKFDSEHQPLVAARVKFEKEQLPARLAQWLQSNASAPQPEKLGTWQSIGPFSAADFKKAYNESFAPEKEIDLAKTYGQLKWTPRPTWTDGKIHNTLSGVNSANYLYRTIEVSQPGPLDISLGRDDAIKVWLNGKSVLAKEVMGGVAADQDKVTLQLKAGSNDLLVKIINAGGPSGFYFSTTQSIPKNIQDIINLAADKRNEKQRQVLLKWFSPRDPDWAKLNQVEQDHLKKQPKPNITKVFAARKNGVTYNFGADTRKVYFLARGNSNTKQGLAPPGVLRVLAAPGVKSEDWFTVDSEGEKSAKQSPRVALADWLTDEQQGAGHLAARVIVNRLWQHHLGRGIVATPSDFGRQGARPTHPALLDFLASELIRSEWKLKTIHKMIMMSAVYRQSGEDNPAAVKQDSENQLWWRRGALRLEAEIIRDTLLSVSGSLDKTMFGKGSLDQASPRRSVYLTVKRSNLVPMLQLFDAPDSIQGIGNRDVTTVPPQALAMMNSPVVRQLAEKFAKRLTATADATLAERIGEAYRLALSRPPSEAESEQMSTFISNQVDSYGGTEQAQQQALADFCQLVLCLNEFMFID
jgi:hypothetical protein